MRLFLACVVVDAVLTAVWVPRFVPYVPFLRRSLQRHAYAVARPVFAALTVRHVNLEALKAEQAARARIQAPAATSVPRRQRPPCDTFGHPWPDDPEPLGRAGRCIPVAVWGW